MVSFEPSPQNMNTIQWDLFKQPPKSKTRDKYCLVFFMRRNEIGLLTTFARINKRGGLRGWEKIKKLIRDPPLALRIREYTDINVRKMFTLGSSRYHNRRRNRGGNYICS